MKTLPFAHQHARCHIAVFLLSDSTEFFTIALQDDKKALTQVHRIKKWANACEEHLKKVHKISQGGKHDVDSALSTIYSRAGTPTTGEELLDAWAAWLWAGATLAHDCRVVYTDVTQKLPCFRFLAQTAWTFALALQGICPLAHEQGSSFYMDI